MSSSNLDWKICKEAFEWDGSLRDIYICETSLDDWQNFLDFLREGEYQVRFLVDKTPYPLPTKVNWIFEQPERPLLSIEISNITLNCHFFIIEEIELDLDPREVTDEAKLNQLVKFISDISLTLGKKVKITPENSSDIALFKFVPANEKVKLFIRS